MRLSRGRTGGEPKTISLSAAPQRQQPGQRLQTHSNGWVHVCFGPMAPAGMGASWVQTVPDKGWFMILRLHGLLEPWFNTAWWPGAIELQP